MSLQKTRTLKADKLIQNYAYGSGVMGFVPVPFLDVIGLIGLQRIMLYRLSKLYGVPFKRNLAKTWITTLLSGVTTSMATPILGQTLLKLIPGVGTAAGSIGMGAAGGATTYAVGKVFQQHFESGGTLDNFDPQDAKTSYQQALKKAREMEQKTVTTAKGN